MYRTTAYYFVQPLHFQELRRLLAVLGIQSQSGTNLDLIQLRYPRCVQDLELVCVQTRDDSSASSSQLAARVCGNGPVEDGTLLTHDRHGAHQVDHAHEGTESVQHTCRQQIFNLQKYEKSRKKVGSSVAREE